MKTIISLLGVWLVIGLGVFLRGFKADSYPVDNNDDGLFYVWAGNSFWDNPFQVTSHSIFDQGNPALIWRSQFMDYIPLERFGFKIVRPWFDHPPLGAALISLPARWLGYTNLEQIPHLIVRYPALVASIFSLWLTYLLAKDLFGEKVGRWSLLFLATIPYFVIAHRQSFLENFLTPVFLGSLVLLRQKRFIALLVLVFCSGWFKITGFIVPLLVGGWLLYKKELKPGWGVIGVGLASALSYLAYGWLTNGQVFWQTLSRQGGRGSFVGSFFYGLTQPEFYGRFNDGWYVLGFLLSFWLIAKYKNKAVKFWAWFFSGWMLVLFLTAGRFANSPWFRYPLFPFVAMAIGYYVNKLIKENSLFLVLPLFLLGMTGFDLAGIEIQPLWLRIFTVLFFLPYGLDLICQEERLKRLTGWLSKIFVIGLVLLNVWVSLRFSTVHCLEERCLAPLKIILSNE
jgi:hypothetical protein